MTLNDHRKTFADVLASVLGPPDERRKRGRRVWGDQSAELLEFCGLLRATFGRCTPNGATRRLELTMTPDELKQLTPWFAAFMVVVRNEQPNALPAPPVEIAAWGPIGERVTQAQYLWTAAAVRAHDEDLGHARRICPDCLHIIGEAHPHASASVVELVRDHAGNIIPLSDDRARWTLHSCEGAA